MEKEGDNSVKGGCLNRLFLLSLAEQRVEDVRLIREQHPTKIPVSGVLFIFHFDFQPHALCSSWKAVKELSRRDKMKTGLLSQNFPDILKLVRGRQCGRARCSLKQTAFPAF